MQLCFAALSRAYAVLAKSILLVSPLLSALRVLVAPLLWSLRRPHGLYVQHIGLMHMNCFEGDDRDFLSKAACLDRKRCCILWFSSMRFAGSTSLVVLQNDTILVPSLLFSPLLTFQVMLDRMHFSLHILVQKF